MSRVRIDPLPTKDSFQVGVVRRAEKFAFSRFDLRVCVPLNLPLPPTV